MPIRYDRTTRTYYDDVTNENVAPPEPVWHNPDGTTNDRP